MVYRGLSLNKIKPSFNAQCKVYYTYFIYLLSALTLASETTWSGHGLVFGFKGHLPGVGLEDPGPNFRNFPKTFSKDLRMSDDIGIPKKFSYPNFRQLSSRFQRTSSFLIFLN